MTDLDYAKALRKCVEGGNACLGCPRLGYCLPMAKNDPSFSPLTSLILEVAERIERTYQAKEKKNCLN